jgi:lipopolysaccharide/colanic/teichoic acid biosynthesis glycosyltransferase
MENQTVSFAKVRTEVENLLIISYLREEVNNKILYLLAKRIFDISLASILLILLVPIFVSTSLAVFFSSGKGIIFSQLRYGKNRSKFRFYKFRSMDCTKSRYSACFVNSEGFLEKSKKDPRVTNVGRIIRKTSIDELPQLFNILKGDMSFVGPRPLIEEMIEPHIALNKLRTIVKPGLTGLWQISNRINNHTVFDMINYDVEYIRECCFILDIKIMLKTIPAVLSCKGAV